jgi:A/G-specific adenine glycosylase
VAPTLIAERRAFQRALLGWYRRQARPLPWRTSPSLYRTVVSEFMLQQTQVKTVLPYFARWLQALPDFASLAAASEAQVLKLWEGLGYYSRARNLHRLSQAMALKSAPPRTPAEWRELPGVGPYTAAAITSISFDAPAACVDGNVVRILARLTADATAHRDSASASKSFQALAEVLLPAALPGDHNQAMMELGATVCLRQNPRCLICPVQSFCAGFRTGRPGDFPRLAPKVIEQRQVLRVWSERAGALLLHRSPGNARRLANLHELPTAEQAGIPAATVVRGTKLAQKRRSITRYQITEAIHAMPAPRGRPRPELVWVPLDELESISLSGPHRRWVREILAGRDSPATADQSVNRSKRRSGPSS